MIYSPMITLEDLEKRVELIEARNKKVELDKAWETSLARKFFVAGLTYLAMGIFMQKIGITKPWLNAVIPGTAFLLSTLTIPLLKDLWIKHKTFK